MNKNWDFRTIIRLLLGIISLVCIIISMYLEGNNIFLPIALLCNAINLGLIRMTKKVK